MERETRAGLSEICMRFSVCILRSVTDSDAFQSGRLAEQNGRSETYKISS